MKYVVLAIFSGLQALLLGGNALAISTLEDTLRLAPRIFRVPSTVPPNNAVHRHFKRSRIHSADEARNPNSPQDEGPDPGERPVSIPGSSAPWTVAVSEGQNLQVEFVCAGALIRPGWVLTAAHCVFNVARRWPNDTRPYVFIGAATLATPGQRSAIEEIILHPKYDPQTLQNDLALLRIASGVTRAGTEIGLRGPPIAEQVGDIGTILGWGITTSVYDQTHRESLQLVQTAIVDDGVCFSPTNFASLRKTGVFCAKSLLKYHDICFRFGGSPMVLYDRNSNLYLAGLVSWNTVCPSESRNLGVFLDVQFHVPWIESVIGNREKQ